MIPVCKPFLGGREKEYVNEALDSNWISSAGKYVGLFEKGFANYCDVEEGIGTCNGTTALHLALKALGLREGDEVIIPDFTMVASALSVCYTGATPVLVDAEKSSWNMDVEKIEEKITENTKAIMVVHIYGNPCDMKKIWEISKKHGLKIIEDAAEAHGAEYESKKCGSLGDISAFSFYANKIVTTGEGGMVVTSNKDLAKKCRYYKNLCFPPEGDRNYLHEEIGFNYRMTNIQAAIGLAQTEKMGEYVEMRIRNNTLYRKLLKDIPGIIFPTTTSGAKNVYWMNGIVIDPEEFGMSRDELIERLKEEGIDSRLFFNGMHRQTCLKKFGCDCSGKYPVSDWLAENGLYLPSSTDLNLEEIEEICQKIINFHKEKIK